MQSDQAINSLAFLTPEYPLPKLGYTGGIGTSVKNLADFYVLKGIEVVIFVYGRTEDCIFEEEGKKFVFIKKSSVGRFGWVINRLKIQKIVNQWVRKLGIQFLEVPEWTGISSFIKFDCPTVLKLHGSDTFFCHLERRKLKSRNFWFEKNAFNQADLIIAVSDFVGKKSTELFGVNRPYEVIHNGINPERSSSHKDNSRTSAKKILYFGSLIRKKGVLEIPGIFNLVQEDYPEVELILAGMDAFDIATGNASTYSMMLEQFSPQAKSKVTYLGLIQSNQIDQLLAQVDICIFPSYAEAFPVSWLEAMYQSKSLVTSDIGWSTEVILSDQVGLTAHPSAHQQFASQILKLLGDDPLRMAMGQAARNCVLKNFSIHEIGRQHLEFFQNDLKKKSS